MTEKMERAMEAVNEFDGEGKALIVAFAQGLAAGVKIAVKDGAKEEEGAEANG